MQHKPNSVTFFCPSSALAMHGRQENNGVGRRSTFFALQLSLVCEQHLKVNVRCHPSHAGIRLCLESTNNKWAHHIITQSRISNLLSLFLRRAFVFLGWQPIATDQRKKTETLVFGENLRKNNHLHTAAQNTNKMWRPPPPPATYSWDLNASIETKQFPQQLGFDGMKCLQ